jgi:hypothetical protein
VHPTVVGVKRELPAERARNRDGDPAVVRPDFDAEKWARLDRRRVDVLSKTKKKKPSSGGGVSAT